MPARLAAVGAAVRGANFLIDAPGSRAKRERSALLRAPAAVVPGLADHRAGVGSAVAAVSACRPRRRFHDWPIKSDHPRLAASAELGRRLAAGCRSGHTGRFGLMSARTGKPPTASESAPTVVVRSSRSAPTPMAGRCERPSACSSRCSLRFRSAFGAHRACPPAARTRPSTSSRRGGGSHANRSCV